jgi:hypothetical protein
VDAIKLAQRQAACGFQAPFCGSADSGLLTGRRPISSLERT